MLTYGGRGHLKPRCSSSSGFRATEGAPTPGPSPNLLFTPSELVQAGSSKRTAGTVVVLNYQGGQWLDDCLSSLKTQTMSGFEILVVDNASTDGSVGIALQQEVPLIQLPKNVGFSAGNNTAHALLQATGSSL